MCGMAVLAYPSGASAQSCAPGPATVQILGSGGPAINRERASASYVLWIGGQARMLVDLGGGSYLRFGQSQAKVSDLALLAISHLHPDHVSDLPAFLWLSHQLRKEPLPIVGPSGNSVGGRPATTWRRILRRSSHGCSTKRMARFRCWAPRSALRAATACVLTSASSM